MANLDPALGCHSCRRYLEQHYQIPHRLVVEGASLRIHFPGQDRSLTFHILRLGLPHLLRSCKVPNQRMDALLWKRLFPQMGQRLQR